MGSCEKKVKVFTFFYFTLCNGKKIFSRHKNNHGDKDEASRNTCGLIFHDLGLKNSRMGSDFIAYIMISSESLIIIAQTENKNYEKVQGKFPEVIPKVSTI